ncbi:MAG: phosphoribosyl-AMP cyclohydrolase [Coriobacteriia bacterium]|nr:phosphoribosyl-AMP cyclohydrolase [Coriobacteriia bacterium]
MTSTERETQALGIDDLLFNADGLIAAIVQETESGEVLMAAWMTREALQKSIDTGYTWFWSRSRKRLWQKGEESGNVQRIASISYDCDGDTLLIGVEQGGDGVACHTGARSCFYRELPLVGQLKKQGKAE